MRAIAVFLLTWLSCAGAVRKTIGALQHEQSAALKHLADLFLALNLQSAFTHSSLGLHMANPVRCGLGSVKRCTPRVPVMNEAEQLDRRSAVKLAFGAAVA